MLSPGDIQSRKSKLCIHHNLYDYYRSREIRIIKRFSSFSLTKMRGHVVLTEFKLREREREQERERERERE